MSQSLFRQPSLAAFLTVAALGFPGLALAQEPAAPAGEAPGRPQTGGLKPFAELTKGATVHAGFLDFYETAEKLYIAVPADRLGHEFMMEAKIAQGIGARGLYGGTMLNLFEGDLVALERRGNQVFLVQRPHRFGAPTDPAAAKAVELTFGSSVLETAKIESVREDSAVVVDVTSWFVGDLAAIGQRMRQALASEPGRPNNVTFDRGRSYLASVKAFPRNVNLRAMLTFRPSEPVGLPSVPDGRYVPIAIHYTLAALPETPMKPRIGDDRVGNFWTVHKDFSQEDTTFFVRYVNRWRLEPGERVGDRWRPRTPITYYIDPNVPAEYRPAFKAGVEAWNAAFEAAGWVDAIRALDLPDGADPEDLRYATLRWNVSDQPGYGAIGPSTVDPRTGEVLDADILFEASMFLGYRNAWKRLAGPVSAADAFEQTLGVGRWTPVEGELELAGFAEHFASQGGLLKAALIARGELRPADPIPMEFVNAATKDVVMHEVGHTLGLQHNFRSSASTPNNRLHDRAWVEENGIYSSVMEYNSINLAPKGQPNGYYFNPGIGSYDRWAITFGYTADDARAAETARLVADQKHLFGTNAESAGPGALDPSINTYDLGADPLAWGAERAALLRGLMQDLPALALADNTGYFELTSAFVSLASEYSRAIAPAIKYLGGQYINRDHVGDPAGRMPFVAIPKAKQQEALTLIVNGVFSEQALALPAEVLQWMGSNRMLHWGSNATFDGRLDFPYHEQVLAFQRSVLNQLTEPNRLSRIRDGETKYGAGSQVTIPELFGAVTTAVWSEMGATPRNVSATRRDLQRAYIDRMTELVVKPPARTPADARSVARAQLTSLNRRLATGLASATRFDAYTRAHLEESRARITKALDAGLEAER
jgi:hypothetical protein